MVNMMRTWASVVAFTTLSLTAGGAESKVSPLDLTGYADEHGAISVQYRGDTIDPYFALQAVLLAKDNGLDISRYALSLGNWMLRRQKPDATFDRFCRNGPVWAACKTADADDAILALWLRFLKAMPQEMARNPAWAKSYQRSLESLSRLLDPTRGVYFVSPVYQHGLFMDNMEVLSMRRELGRMQPGIQMPTSEMLARNIERIFRDGKTGNYWVSTQPEQKFVPAAFYPDHVAQVYPLIMGIKLPGHSLANDYRMWMQTHRKTWLAQSRTDFSWGLIAVMALRNNDRASARCWLRETAQAQRTAHWIVTDEVARQILVGQGVEAADDAASCV